MNWLHEYVARWHDTWEVVGALATAGAVIVALAGISHERRKTRDERQRADTAEAQRDAERQAIENERTENIKEARRQQALRVVAFPLWKTDQAMLDGNEIGHWRIQLGNYSDAPIFDVRVETYVGDKREGAAEQATLASHHEAWIEKRSLGDRAAPPVALMYFRDVAGARWRREQSGRLTEVDEHRGPIPGAPVAPAGTPVEN